MTAEGVVKSLECHGLCEAHPAHLAMVAGSFELREDVELPITIEHTHEVHRI